ncbi:unnamed protein product [Musa banksii]
MPRTLGGLCSLTDLRLNSNNFNGELADVVDGLSSCSGGAAFLQVLHLSRNSVTGQLPETIGKLDLLQSLDISDQPLIRADAEDFRWLVQLN